ncbi:hypothetical protein LUZ61_019794 [Rhynchospora tenuis]|uniref:Uncharacterized protein n=1 Tax=Rhynchospora tenuis TaxID=198213 RepID=A0AAD6EN53_9POAL|nr:hypothetical protein LUZ61_019794 [Rhynchospora tenuis]
MAFVLIATIKIQNEHLKIDLRASQLRGQQQVTWRRGLEGLPRGDDSDSCNALLAMAVGISQKQNVDRIVSKFMMENCSATLFHYDGNVDGWQDLSWNNKVIHIVAQNQTKWWFAKRFMHPDVVSTYDHIFLWDEDLGVDNFNPRSLLLTQTKSTDIHHRITVRNQRRIVHRRIYSKHGSLNCSSASKGPPCTGWVEGMAPVFSQAAWRCVWYLIQLGYCAQGDRTKKVGVMDKEFVVHQGIPTLGGPSLNKPPRRSLDMRTKVRRQSTAELAKFKERWNKAVQEDKKWRDPFDDLSSRIGR